MIVTVTHQWTDEKGRCYECGDPAAFVVPNAYRDRTPRKEHLRCAVCAANAVAYDNEQIIGLFPDDDERSEREALWANAYPLPAEPTS